MITKILIQPALKAARAKTAKERKECSILGMVKVLEEFETESVKFGASRAIDGLMKIDSAVASLKQDWPRYGANAQFKTNVDSYMEDLLAACISWLADKPVLGGASREDSIRNLYWKTAWCYASELYATLAKECIRANNSKGVPTSVFDPVDPTGTCGNPYEIDGEENYKWSVLPTSPRLLHGETRGPDAIYNANGFQPYNLSDVGDSTQYGPWFDGHNGGDTISLTTDENLAVNAGTASKNKKSAMDDVPAWMHGLLPPDSGHDVVQDSQTDRIIAFVYEIQGADKKLSVSMSHNNKTENGKKIKDEETWLAIPNKCIKQWWAVHKDHHTFGPLTFGPVTQQAPVLSVQPTWSAEPYKLA